MKFSIVVPAFNEEQLLPATLARIHAATRAFAGAHDWELIVCDNNSTDRTAEIAHGAGARVVFEPVNQIGRARNRGAAAAAGDWLVFVDADSQPSPGLFGDMLRAVERGDCLAGGSTIAAASVAPAFRFGIRAWNALSRLNRWAAGSFMFCDAAAFRELAGFSDELYASEELELFRRLKRVARARRQRIVILHRHPLATSDRKLRLYGWREHAAFFGRMLLRPRRTLRSAAACRIWYDGRR
ncbi:MAG: glycosyltransferase [Burkholderiales bacterium]